MGIKKFTGTDFSKLKLEASNFVDRLESNGGKFQRAEAKRLDDDQRQIIISFIGDDPDKPNCEVCGQVVDQSIAGKTVNSNGKHWHGKCYETQEKLDQAIACWEVCVERLKAIHQHQQYKP